MPDASADRREHRRRAAALRHSGTMRPLQARTRHLQVAQESMRSQCCCCPAQTRTCQPQCEGSRIHARRRAEERSKEAKACAWSTAARATFKVVQHDHRSGFSGAKRLKHNAQSQVHIRDALICHSLKSPKRTTGPFFGAPLDSDSSTNSLMAWRISRLDSARALTPRSS